MMGDDIETLRAVLRMGTALSSETCHDLLDEVERLSALVNAKQSWIDGAKVDIEGLQDDRLRFMRERDEARAAIALQAESVEAAAARERQARAEVERLRTEVERTRSPFTDNVRLADRAEKAEAAIGRVEALCDKADSAFGDRWVRTADTRAALRGDQP